MQPLTRDMQLGPYRIEGVIGAGGMGVVRSAVDARLGRRVAVKVTDKRFTCSRSFVQSRAAVTCGSLLNWYAELNDSAP